MATLFRCRSCDQTFGSKIERDGHTRLMHGDTMRFKHPDGTVEILRKTANRGFLCPVDTCALPFARADTLRRHHTQVHAHRAAAATIDRGNTNFLVNVGLCITPSPSQTPQILTNANLCIVHHERLVLLVCLVEHEALLSNNQTDYRGIVNHVRKHQLDMSPSSQGGSILDRADYENQLLEALKQFNFTRLGEAPILPFTCEPEAGLRPPVPGIVILHGFSCKKCTYFCGTRRTMDNHRLSKHSDLSILDIREGCQVQRLGKVGLKYFGVLHHNLDLDQDQAGNSVSMDELIMKDFEEHAKSMQPGSQPPVVELSPWLRESRWHDIAAEFMPQGIPFVQVKAQMLKPPKDDTSPLSYVSRLVAIYMDRIQHLAYGAVDYRLRRLVEKTFPEDNVTVGFNPLYSPSSWDRYSDLMTSFILCLLRSQDGSNNACKQFCTDRRDLGEALRRLMSQLLGMDESSVKDADLLIIHEVMLLLWTPEIPEALQARTATDCLFTRFLILESLVKLGHDPAAEGYGFRPVRYLTQPMAILKYWGKGVVLMHLAQPIWNPDDTATVLLNDEVDCLLRYLSDVALPTPFTTICQYLRLATKITSGTPTLPRLVPLGANNTACLIDGERITLDAFREMVHIIAAEAQHVLKRDVLLGLNIDWLEELLKEKNAIHDNINDGTPLYAFPTDPRNRVLQQHRTDLVKHLFQNPTIKGHFISGRSDDDKILWNSASLRRLMVSCDKLSELLNLIIHFAAGLPARGEEYKSFLMRNTSAGERSFFWAAAGGDDEADTAHDAVEPCTVSLYQTYHKGANNGAPMKPLVRFVPYSLRVLFLAYFCLVRPVQSYVAQKLWEPASKVGLLYQDCWFVGMGKRLTGDDLSQSIRNAFHKHCGVSIGLSEYRHLAAYFSEKIRKEHNDILDDFVDVAGGHTTETVGHHYAQSARDLRAMDGHLMRGFRLVTNKWQKLLRFSTTSRDVTLVTRTTPTPPGATSTTVRPRIDIDVQMERGPEKVRLVCVPGYGETLLSSAPSSSSSSSSCCCAQNGDSSLFHIRPETTVQAYKALRRMGHTQWKTNEQAIAVALAIENTVDFVAILPTGSGKSLVFMAPSALIEKTVIVVVPFKALVVSHLGECRKANIDHGLYTGRDPLHADVAPAIVFVVVDTVGESEAFGTFLSILCARDKLHSIVLDEIHTLQSKFRPTMRNLIFTMKQHCQVIGLTASLPPKDQIEIELILGTRMHWVRSCTVRPNIRYMVAEVHDVDKEIIEQLRHWKRCVRANADRALVYCLTRDEVEGLGNLLQSRDLHCTCLHSGFSTPDTTEILKKWESGNVEIMVATSVIGCGYNYHAVRLVIHKGTFRNMEQFHQESGRAGRDGGPATSCVVSSKTYRDRASRMVGGDGDLQIPFKWIQEKDRCRRFALHMHVDGKPQTCYLIPGAIACDTCTSTATDDPTIDYMRMEFEEGATQEGATLQVEGNLIQSPRNTTVLEPTTTVVARVRPVLVDQGLEEARNDVKIMRKISKDGKNCLLCWNLQSRSFEIHTVARCPRAGKLCFKCLGNHTSAICPNKFPPHADTCFRCHFPHQPDRMQFHQGLYGAQCQDQSGEKLRLLMWDAWRDKTVQSKLFRSIPEIKGKTDRELCQWVISPRQGGVGNNFVRLVATIVRMKYPEIR